VGGGRADSTRLHQFVRVWYRYHYLNVPVPVPVRYGVNFYSRMRDARLSTACMSENEARAILAKLPTVISFTLQYVFGHANLAVHAQYTFWKV